MSTGTAFINNLGQAVRLPESIRLPDGVREVEIRAVGNERIIAPLGKSWDIFILGGLCANDDSMAERTNQQPEQRVEEWCLVQEIISPPLVAKD